MGILALAAALAEAESEALYLVCFWLEMRGEGEVRRMIRAMINRAWGSAPVLNVVLAGAVLLVWPLSAAAQSNAEPRGTTQDEESPLVLEGVRVTPPRPGAETLAELSVSLRNSGQHSASQLAFTVRVDGRALPAYQKQLWYQEIPRGDKATVRLFNFWPTETGRELPADGKLRVEVTLDSARWFEVEHTPAAGEQPETETWRPVGDVPGLPHTVGIDIDIDLGR